MTVIRTYRQSGAAGYCRECRTQHGPWGHREFHSERVFRDPVLAGAWADFMALAGYVVEMEGDRA